MECPEKLYGCFGKNPEPWRTNRFLLYRRQSHIRVRKAGFSEYLVKHLSAMAELTKQGRYDRMTDTMYKLTGEAPTNMRDFVLLHNAEFEQRIPAAQLSEV